LVAPLDVGATAAAHATHVAAPVLPEKCPGAHASHAVVPLFGL
jgi:hypothetical protein